MPVLAAHRQHGCAGAMLWRGGRRSRPTPGTGCLAVDTTGILKLEGLRANEVGASAVAMEHPIHAKTNRVNPAIHAPRPNVPEKKYTTTGPAAIRIPARNRKILRVLIRPCPIQRSKRRMSL